MMTGVLSRGQASCATAKETLKAALEQYSYFTVTVSLHNVMLKLWSPGLRLTHPTPHFVSFFFFCGGFSLMSATYGKAVILALALCVEDIESVCGQLSRLFRRGSY